MILLNIKYKCYNCDGYGVLPPHTIGYESYTVTVTAECQDCFGRGYM